MVHHVAFLPEPKHQVMEVKLEAGAPRVGRTLDAPVLEYVVQLVHLVSTDAGLGTDGGLQLHDLLHVAG